MPKTHIFDKKNNQKYFFYLPTGELEYDGPLYDGFLHTTDDMLGPSPMHIKYASYVCNGFCIWLTNFPGPIESVISKFTCTYPIFFQTVMYRKQTISFFRPYLLALPDSLVFIYLPCLTTWVGRVLLSPDVLWWLLVVLVRGIFLAVGVAG